MKFKKGISLLLVLTVVLSFMSFAFTAFAVADTANLSFVADKDTSTLKAGDIFTVSVKLDNIVAKEFRSAQVAGYFDPAVLTIVDSAGAPTTNAGKAYIESNNMYDADEETGYGERVGASIDNVDGLFMYAFGKHRDSTMNSIACADGTYTVVQVRFKVLKEGMTKLQFAVKDEAPEYIETFPAGYKVNCGDPEALATITDNTESIRIGIAKLDITSVDAIADQVVAIDTALADVIASLPTKADVTFDDASKGKVNVTEWKCPSYKADTAGDYTFEGTLATSATVTNSKSLKATVKVTVKKLSILSVASGTVNVPHNATKEQVDQLLPKTVSVTVEGNKQVNLPATWTYTYTAGTTTGDVAAEGAVAVGTKYTNTEDKKAAYTLKVSQAVTAETGGTIDATSIPSKVTVPFEGDKAEDDVVAQLPQTVQLQLAGGGTVTAFVTWAAPAGYDPEKAGNYTFVGTVTAPTNVTLASNAINMPVTISPAATKVVKTVNYTFEDKTTDTSSKLLTSLYPSTVPVTYQDGTTGSEAIVWDATSLAYRANNAGTYTLNGKVGAISVTAKVTVKGDTPAPPYTALYIYLNGKTINNGTIGMYTGNVMSVSASTNVTWSSSNNSIALATRDGKIVANAPGMAVITAQSSNNYAVFYVRVTLNPATIISLTDDDDEEVVIPFSDLGDFSWASRMISILANKGVLSGRTSTLFAPADHVTRAEYAAMLVRGLNLSTSAAGKAFDDVEDGQWYYNTVQTASALGIISGYEDNTFKPNNNITREEMAVMSLRAAKAASLILPAGNTVTFNDADQISEYAREAVDTLSQGTLITGMGNGNFAPQETANRAQAAVIIFKLNQLLQ